MEILVPLSPFIMVIALVWLGAWSRAKSNKEVQKSIQKAIEKGVELTPETIKAMGVQERSPQSDLRSGLILIAIAFGLIVLSFGISEAGESSEIIAIMTGVAAIPGFIGVALLMMHFFMKKDK
ncbi:MAG: DUF6249 domain-containing protein [Robiginitomaculum sp.]|nr:DUF6249 domain-containing protein [Robiginitomaculum sp.]MDQ7077555.1 DUF6249 domain-containing protein [Robiginitomaculum sp.]